jgi:hypothetical protein
MRKKQRKNEIRLFVWELESMPEYSSSLPTGQVLFKMWRRAIQDLRTRAVVAWQAGQYVPCRIPGNVGIRWFDVVLRAGPKPPAWEAPDWNNRARYQREGFYKNPCVCGNEDLVGEPPKCRQCGRRYAV